MDQQTIILIVGVVVVVAAIVAFMAVQRRRSAKLKDRFGPEYDRTVEEAGAKGRAEAQLHKLEKRGAAFDIKPLSPEAQQRYVEAWAKTQAEFVDDPLATVTAADGLLGDVMAARGYPVSDFDQRSADLSVDHPVVVQNYRAAHDIAVREGQATTEDLRQAMIHYRALYEELVSGATPVEATPEPKRSVA